MVIFRIPAFQLVIIDHFGKAKEKAIGHEVGHVFAIEPDSETPAFAVEAKAENVIIMNSLHNNGYLIGAISAR